jgi:hypothetical protein
LGEFGFERLEVDGFVYNVFLLHACIDSWMVFVLNSVGFYPQEYSLLTVIEKALTYQGGL